MDYLKELWRTPEILAHVMDELPEEQLAHASFLVFCGCGTSYYLCAQLARLCNAAGKPAAAMDAVELLDGALPVEQGAIFVFLSRSGGSLETILAQQVVSSMGFRSFYLGCTAGSPLDLACDGSRVISFADERMVLESYSSTAQFLCLARCCGLTADPGIPALITETLKCAQSIYRENIAEKRFRRFICLGAPFYTPLLRELMLKNGELTQTCSEAWGILEFRHGPRSWADENCLITVIPGKRTLDFDRRVVDELITYGCTVLWCGPEAPEGTIPVPLNVRRQSLEELLALMVFQPCLAANIGQAAGIDACRLQHMVRNVEAL